MFHEVDQNTDEWFELRLGKPTSSNFAKIMANEGKAFGSSSDRIRSKISFRNSYRQKETRMVLKTHHMERGHEEEPIAIELYEEETFYSVR